MWLVSAGAVPCDAKHVAATTAFSVATVSVCVRGRQSTYVAPGGKNARTGIENRIALGLSMNNVARTRAGSPMRRETHRGHHILLVARRHYCDPDMALGPRHPTRMGVHSMKSGVLPGLYTSNPTHNREYASIGRGGYRPGDRQPANAV